MCLISATGDKAACERLSAMEKTEDGFKLAEYDLSLRREGDILGDRQHGASVLKLVNVVRDGAVDVYKRQVPSLAHIGRRAPRWGPS